MKTLATILQYLILIGSAITLLVMDLSPMYWTLCSVVLVTAAGVACLLEHPLWQVACGISLTILLLTEPVF